MGFLLTKILFLLAIATACGGLFSYWWFRRHYEDVTLEYTRSRTEWAAWRRSLEERLGARPQVDLAPLRVQMQAVEDAVRSLPHPGPTDLVPLEARLEGIERRLGALRPAEGAAGVSERLAALETLVRRLAERSPGNDL